MKIILKFLFSSIKESKLRSSLIIFAVAIGAALCFSSLGVANNFENMVKEKYTAQFGKSDFLITAKEDSPNPYLDENELDSIEAKNKVYNLNLTGFYKLNDKSTKINFIFGDIEKINEINKIDLLEGDFNKINNNSVIVSKSFSKDNNLEINDEFKVKIQGQEKKLVVGAIADDKGFFAKQAGKVTIIGDKESLTNFFDLKLGITSALIEIDDDSNFNSTYETLKNNLKDYKISKTLDDKGLKDAVNQFMIPFYIMVTVVLLMAVFIIYSSFKVIVLDRMNSIGTFRSLGATKLSTNTILIIESILYGVLGGILGDILGIPLLYFMTKGYIERGNAELSLHINYMLIAFILAIILCVISALIPILNINKITVKDIILGSHKQNKEESKIKFILGLILFITPYLYIKLNPNSGNFIMSVIWPFMVLISMTILIPYVVKLVGFILKPVFRLIFGNIGVIGVTNVTTIKNLLHNIVLLSLGLGAVIIVYTASYSVDEMVVSSFKGLNYSYNIGDVNSQNGEFVLNNLHNNDEVKEYYENYYKNQVEVKDKNFKLGYLQGIDADKYVKFYSNFDIYDSHEDLDEKQILNKLNDGKNIILSDVIQKKYKVNSGEKIATNFNGDIKEYEVIGFISSELSSNSNNCLISEENFKNDMNQKYPNSIYVKSDNDDLKSTLTNDLENYDIFINSKEEEESALRSENGDLMMTLQSFSIIALIMGAFGMINNLIVTYLARKRELAVLSSVGMSKVQRVKLMFVEGLFSGIIGGILGIVSGVILIAFIPEITLALDTYLSIKVPTSNVLILGAFGAMIMIISSFVPILKSKKLSIVEEIKYE